MKDFAVWQFIRDKLNSGKKVVLVSVLNSQGSSPGKAGFKMAVAQNKEYVGTIGGGEMEKNILEQCRKILSAKNKIIKHEKLFHNKKTSKLQSGLICAGTQTMFTYTLDKKDSQLISEIIQIFESGGTGILKYSEKGIELVKDTCNKETVKYFYENESNWSCEENIGVLETIYIVGGGHVGLALSRQMEMLGFHVVVFDDRKDIKTVKENIYADEIIITAFENIGAYIKENNYSYAAVVTSSYLSDKAALMQLLGKKIKYIGLMGSAAKLKKIFDELKAEGFSNRMLNKIHAPIGIKIKAETVSEIAVSIAAEIIKIKNPALSLSRKHH
jgi:xanthine dehydrogenase accessory factor